MLDRNRPETWPEPYKDLYRIFVEISRGWWQANIDENYPWVQYQFEEARQELTNWVEARVSEH
jgi:hypothetical protein